VPDGAPNPARCIHGYAVRDDDPTVQECIDRQKQLAWLDEMERIEQEVFPDARPRSEVVVEISSDE
jgi:hypothetical protein